MSMGTLFTVPIELVLHRNFSPERVNESCYLSI
jgi:hypothetical protein